MFEHTRTRKGWAIDITHTVHGMLEQGGLSGRRVLVRDETLKLYGIDPDNPESADMPVNEHGTTAGELLMDFLRRSDWRGDQVLRRGHVIQ
jgi:hypothetical protein